MSQAAGMQVTVLEARGRMGGRAYTDTDTFDMPDGGGVDMGAM
jgi:monoamine oxidase